MHRELQDRNERTQRNFHELWHAQQRRNHLAALHMVKMQGGVFGAVATSTALLGALTKAAA